MGGYPRRRTPREYSAYLKAYSMAMLPGKERTNVSYGGKSECILAFEVVFDF